jgi:SAM-dependent methyltransferase
MDERHTNRELYFKEQGTTIDKYVLPFIEDVMKIDENTSVLEIGCGEGGNLLPFVKRGCSHVVGIDMSEGKIANAKKYFAQQDNYENVKFMADDIYNIDPKELGQFDIIITRDVLEHIHNQEKFMHFVQGFMKPDGKFFLGFPPWHNPFGGHQQICRNKFLSRFPYFHILPKPIYKGILKAFGESDGTIEALLEIKDTRITIERFERILKKEKFQKNKRVFYFINPNYEIKFGLKPRIAWPFVSGIPYLRNLWITTNYYIISKSEK